MTHGLPNELVSPRRWNLFGHPREFVEEPLDPQHDGQQHRVHLQGNKSYLATSQR